MKYTLILLLLLTQTTFANKIDFYPKSATQTFGIVTVKPNSFDSTKTYMTWICGAGIGERGDGSLAALQKLVGWGGFGNLKAAVDQYDFILVFVNTANNYEKGEYQYALKWIQENVKYDINNLDLLTHSLGGYGAGNYAFSDPAFAAKINIWFNSASGPYSNVTIFQNIVTSKIKHWGVCAANDVVSGTDPKYVTQVYTKVKAIDPLNPVMVTEFPSTTWDSKTAHNAVLGRLTGIGWTGIDYSMFVDKSLTAAPKMNIYQWALSNPKGSIYQKPDHAYSGPVYSQPIPQPTQPTAYFREFINTSDGVYKITYSDGSYLTYKIPSGDALSQQYAKPGSDGKYYLVIQTKAGIKKIFDKK